MAAGDATTGEQEAVEAFRQQATIGDFIGAHGGMMAGRNAGAGRGFVDVHAEGAVSHRVIEAPARRQIVQVEAVLPAQATGFAQAEGGGGAQQTEA